MAVCLAIRPGLLQKRSLVGESFSLSHPIARVRGLHHASVREDRVRGSGHGPGRRLSQRCRALPQERHLLLQREGRPLALLRASPLPGEDVPDTARRVQPLQRVGRQDGQGGLHQTHHGLLTVSAVCRLPYHIKIFSVTKLMKWLMSQIPVKFAKTTSYIFFIHRNPDL